MACENVNQDLWNWKTGQPFLATIGQLKIPFNYFSCGTYYFDGMFRVVKFPKGLMLFHGSGAVANANVEFPLGKNFYDPEIPYKIKHSDVVERIQSNQDESIQEILSEDEIVESWYGDLNTAQLYSLQNPNFSSTCDTKCINTYKLKKDAVFFILDDNFNLWQLLNDPRITPEITRAIYFMFNIKDNSSFENDEQTFGGLFLKNKIRKSNRDYDLPFARWLCSIIKDNYAGYAANQNVTGRFHLEFSFCNATKYLKRTYENPKDWQHLDFSSADDIVREFFRQLSYYKTTNNAFHSGDLLQHSIWCLLFAEQIVLREINNYNQSILKKIAILALIHDIGKMDPVNCIKRKNSMVYFSLPSHPRLGSDYIKKIKQLPILDKDMNIVDYFDMDRLLAAFGIEEQDVETSAMVVDHHWDFGYYLSRWNGQPDDENVQAFIDSVSEGVDLPVLYFFIVLTVSIADIMATQPYGMNNLTRELNHRSYFFPFITNMPKKYKGTSLSDETMVKRNAFSKAIMDRVKKR